jgi:hypothetical protein
MSQYAIRAQWWNNKKQMGIAVDDLAAFCAGDALYEATPEAGFTHGVVVIRPSKEMGEPPYHDILDKLADLHKQATVERSHYYVARCVIEAIAEIKKLRQLVRKTP